MNECGSKNKFHLFSLHLANARRIMQQQQRRLPKSIISRQRVGTHYAHSYVGGRRRRKRRRFSFYLFSSSLFSFYCRSSSLTVRSLELSAMCMCSRPLLKAMRYTWAERWVSGCCVGAWRSATLSEEIKLYENWKRSAFSGACSSPSYTSGVIVTRGTVSVWSRKANEARRIRCRAHVNTSNNF